MRLNNCEAGPSFDKKQLLVCVLLFFLGFVFYSHFVYHNISGDDVSIYYPAKQLLQQNTLNSWNPLNDLYNTYYFKLLFADTVIYDWGKSYPAQAPGCILLAAFVIRVFGNSFFFYISPFFGALTIVFAYLIVEGLLGDRKVALLSSLILFSMPVFVIWGIIPQNIMPATAFLTVSLYCILKFQSEGKLHFLFLSGSFFAFSVFTRLPHIFFAPAFVALFYDKSRKSRLDFRRLLQFAAPILIILMIAVLFNWNYFGDPFFVGYLKTNYHPVPPGYKTISTQPYQPYLLSGFSPSNVLNAVRIFFIASNKIFFVLLPIALLGFFVKNSRTQKFKIFFAIILVISLFYYGQLEPNLWHDFRPEFRWALCLAFFRYLLPVYVLSAILLSLVIIKIVNLSTSRLATLLICSLIAVLATTYVVRSLDYEGGSNLRYLQEINSKVINYSKRVNRILEKDSIILFADRWALSFTYPYSMDYDWFYYDGIPPSYRYSHTKEVVNKSLNDQRTVYFLGYEEPYDTLTKETEVHLRRDFDFAEVEGSWFPRMKARFYRLSQKETQ